MPDDLAARAHVLPKVLLHEHLDGGLRPGTLVELLHTRGLTTPAAQAGAMRRWFADRAHAGSLVEYLRGFALTVAAMATPAGLERVAFEAAEDARDDGCVLAEFRIAPLLFEPHGVPAEAAIEAMLTGLARAPLPCGLILCAMRHHGPDESERVAALALRYRAQGTIGFDLAGPEHGHPPSDHYRAFALARDAGLPITCHAGEADAGARVLEAARLGATRIGHGVRLVDLLGAAGHESVLDELHTRGVHLEVCPTSNVHTGAATSIATHPITTLWRAGVSLSFHTDNRLMSQVTHSGEALALLRGTSLVEADLLRMGVQAAAHSFLPAQARQRALDHLQAFAAV